MSRMSRSIRMMTASAAVAAFALVTPALAGHGGGGGFHGGGGFGGSAWHGGGGGWHGGGGWGHGHGGWGHWHGGHWHGGWGHGGGGGWHHGWGGPRFFAGGTVSYGYGGCYVRRLVPTPWGPRWRMINRCY